ncbi:MAG: glyoxalase superfamily protein [Pseudomonadota bacterium]
MTDLRHVEWAKARARTLRAALAEMGHGVAHGQALDLVARQEGVRDWNALAARLAPLPPLGPVPTGWMRAGARAESYDMGLDAGAGPDGGPCASIRLRPGADPADGFGTLMQKVEAAPWCGRRVSLTGRLRASGVQGAVTIWLRADGAERGATLAFDNMEDRDGAVLSSDTGWEVRRIVLDIPDAARALAFGVYLRGAGQAWCASLGLDLAPDLPVTSEGPVPAPRPVNTGFSAGGVLGR